MNNQIGFRYPGRDLPEVAAKQKKTAKEVVPSATQILHHAGFAQAFAILAEYLNRKKMPFVQREARDEWMVGKMRKVRERYFEELDGFDEAEFRQSFMQLLGDADF